MVNSFGQFTGDVRVSGHISQAGERWVCVGSVDWMDVGVYFFKERGGSYMLRCSVVAEQSPWDLDPYSPPLLPSQRTKQMGPALGNDKKMHWVHWVGGKRDCFANEVGKRGCGPLGGRVSTSTESSIRSCRLLHILQVKWLPFLYAAVVATVWTLILINCP